MTYSEHELEFTFAKKILTEYFLSISHSALVRFPVALVRTDTKNPFFRPWNKRYERH